MTKPEPPATSQTEPGFPSPGKGQRLLVAAGLCALVTITACVAVMAAMGWGSADLLSCHACHM